MRRNLIIGMLTIAAIVAGFIVFQNGNDAPYKIKDNMIYFSEPERAEGQTSMLGFAAEPIDTVRVGIIGLGRRGVGFVKRYTLIETSKVVAICDLLQERLDNSQEIIKKWGGEPAEEYISENGWKQLCERDDIDLVCIVTPWECHVPMATYAMECGKHVAVEVPAAMSVEECWQLVDTSERTRRHCMMLENCIYDHFELTTLNMAQQGLFGEIIHGEGGYIHGLSWFIHNTPWRLEFNVEHRGDVYATHGLGPICFAMDIHRGDRMTHLVSMDTDPWVGREVVKKRLHTDEIANGDLTTTYIRTHKGKTIKVQHNVMTPRPYNRLHQLTGTKGFANKYPTEGILLSHETMTDGGVADIENLSDHKFLPKEQYEALMEKYRHPIQIELMEYAKKIGGHGGMDYIMDYRLIYCLNHGLPLDQDVYDAAEWSCIGELSAASMEHNSMPVAFPDFTRGDWDKLKGHTFATKK